MEDAKVPKEAMTTDPRKLAQDVERILHLIPYPSIRNGMSALCRHLIAALDERDKLRRIAIATLTIYASNQAYAAHMGDPAATVDYVPAAEALAALKTG